MGGVRHYPGPSDYQRPSGLLSGEEGRQCNRDAEEEACPGGPRAAGWRMEADSRSGPSSWRRRPCPFGRHSAGGHQAIQRAVPGGRSVGADRRVAAGREVGQRHKLFQLPGAKGRDGRPSGRHRPRHIFREDHEAGGGGPKRGAFSAQCHEDWELPHRDRRCAGRNGLHRRHRTPREPPGNIAVRSRPYDRLDPGGPSRGAVRHHGHWGDRSGQKRGDRQQAGGDRGDGRGRCLMQRQDRDHHPEQVDGGQGHRLWRPGRGPDHIERRPGLAGRGQRSDR